MLRTSQLGILLGVLGLATPALATDLGGLPQQMDGSAVSAYSGPIVEVAFPVTERTSDRSVVMGPAGEACVFSADGRFVFVKTTKGSENAGKGGYGTHLNKIDAATGKIVGDIPLTISTFPNNPLKGVMAPFKEVFEAQAMASHGNLLAVMTEVSQRNDVREPIAFVPVLFDVTTGKPLKKLGGGQVAKGNGAANVIFSPDGKYLVAEVECSVFAWEVASGKTVAGIKTACGGWVGQPRTAVVGSQLHMWSGEGDAVRLQVYDLATAKPVNQVGSGWKFPANPQFFGFSPSGRQTIFEMHRTEDDDPNATSCSNGPCPRIFNLPGMQEVGLLKVWNDNNACFIDYAGDSERLAWSKDESHLLITGFDDEENRSYGVLYDMQGNRALDILKLPLRKDTFHKVGTTPDGTFLILGQHPTQPGLRVLRWKP